MWRKTALFVVVLLMLWTFQESGMFRGAADRSPGAALSATGPRDLQDQNSGETDSQQPHTNGHGTSGQDETQQDLLSNDEARRAATGDEVTGTSSQPTGTQPPGTQPPEAQDPETTDLDVTGNATGNTTGNTTGNATGNATGNTSGDEDADPGVIEIVISAVGDCTLGGDIRAGFNGFMREYNSQEYDCTYFLRNVSPVFRADDLTIANMEGTFASPGAHKDKEYVLSGPPELVNVFTSSGVDVVSIANNHTMDYWQRGYDETVAVLADAGISFFGNEYTTIIDVKGVKIGLFGYSLQYITRTEKDLIATTIRRLREDGADIVIAYYHWGIEHERYPNTTQREIAHHTIDSGADLVLGSHPHVLQGIEEYNGKTIVYSLGNFCFGANNNPVDKDTIIYQQTFIFTDGVLTYSNWEIIPCSVSSVRDRNNYQPVILEGDEAERVFAKVNQLSSAL